MTEQGLQFVERNGKYYITGGTEGDVEIPKEAYDQGLEALQEEDDEA